MLSATWSVDDSSSRGLPLDALSFEGFLSTRSPRLMATAQPAEEDTAPKASVDGEPLDDKQKAAILKEVAEGKAAARAQAQKIIASKKSASLGIKIGTAVRAVRRHAADAVRRRAREIASTSAGLSDHRGRRTRGCGTASTSAYCKSRRR